MRARTAILGLLVLFALYCVAAVWWMRKGAGSGRFGEAPERTEAGPTDSRPVLTAAPRAATVPAAPRSR